MKIDRFELIKGKQREKIFSDRIASLFITALLALVGFNRWFIPERFLSFIANVFDGRLQVLVALALGILTIIQLMTFSAFFLVSSSDEDIYDEGHQEFNRWIVYSGMLVGGLSLILCKTGTLFPDADGAYSIMESVNIVVMAVYFITYSAQTFSLAVNYSKKKQTQFAPIENHIFMNDNMSYMNVPDLLNRDNIMDVPEIIEHIMKNIIDVYDIDILNYWLTEIALPLVGKVGTVDVTDVVAHPNEIIEKKRLIVELINEAMTIITSDDFTNTLAVDPKQNAVNYIQKVAYKNATTSINNYKGAIVEINKKVAKQDFEEVKSKNFNSLRQADYKSMYQKNIDILRAVEKEVNAADADEDDFNSRIGEINKKINDL